MAAPRFSLRTLLGFLVLVSVLLCGVAAAYREREAARDEEAYRRIVALYEARLPLSSGPPPACCSHLADREPDEHERLLKHLLSRDRGSRYLQELDSRSRHVAFDRDRETVYYVTVDWGSLKWGHGEWRNLLRLSRISREGPPTSLENVLFTPGSFEPELTVEEARALFSDPHHAAPRE